MGERILDDEGRLIGSDEELVIGILKQRGYTESGEEDKDNSIDGVDTLSF